MGALHDTDLKKVMKLDEYERPILMLPVGVLGDF
jgi:hypothetical protein